jgi:anaerobic selenocysteine-containing dehydrogenase
MSESTLHTTTCPLDCPDSCALQVIVDDGIPVRIDGGEGHPVTSGFICGKVRSFGRRLLHDDRLLYPMRRVGKKGAAKFERITWEQAIAEITGRFGEIVERWGGEAILPFRYGGSNGLLSNGLLDDLYFARLGASRLAATICAAPATAVAVGMYGKMPGVAFQDYAQARCIVIWGANPRASNIHLMPYLRKAKERGAFVAVVDPARNLADREVDLHLPVRPGSDLVVALATVKLLHDRGLLDTEFLSANAKNLEPLLAAADEWPVDKAAAEAGVTASDIVRLTDAYAQSSPAVIRCGWGVERNRNGGQAIAAILSLPALLGKFGVRGGGYTLSNNGAAKFDAAELLGLHDWNTRVVNMTRLGEALNSENDPPVKGIFVYNANPAVTVPDQGAILKGLAREDLFTVVFDQVLTDTAAFADIALPATTFLEHWDLRVSYGSYTVGGVRPVMEPRGEARSNVEVFAELGRAMGFTDVAFGWDSLTVFRKVVGGLTLNGAKAEADVLAAGGWQEYQFRGATPIQFATIGPQTADARIDLCPADLGDKPYAYHSSNGDGFPLKLISPATSKMISSTFGEFNFRDLYVVVHPEDAGDRGIEEGDAVRVYNELGEVLCRAAVSDRIRSGVVLMPKGAWRKSSRNGMTATALCPSHVNEVGGGACFNDARVEIAKDT